MSRTVFDVVSFGEILWDVIEGVPHLGGAPFNFAAHCVRGLSRWNEVG
jgi:fructokinase